MLWHKVCVSSMLLRMRILRNARCIDKENIEPFVFRKLDAGFPNILHVKRTNLSLITSTRYLSLSEISSWKWLKSATHMSAIASTWLRNMQSVIYDFRRFWHEYHNLCSLQQYISLTCVAIVLCSVKPH